MVYMAEPQQIALCEPSVILGFRVSWNAGMDPCSNIAHDSSSHVLLPSLIPS